MSHALEKLPERSLLRLVPTMLLLQHVKTPLHLAAAHGNLQGRALCPPSPPVATAGCRAFTTELCTIAWPGKRSSGGILMSARMGA